MEKCSMFCCFWKKTPNSPAYIRKGKSSSVENIMDYGQNLRYDIQSQILQPRYKYYLNYVGNYHRIIQHWTVPGWQQSRHWKIPMPARLPPRNDIVNFKVKLLLNKSGTHKIVIVNMWEMSFPTCQFFHFPLFLRVNAHFT